MLFPSSFTPYASKNPCEFPCLPSRPDATWGLPRFVQITELGRSRDSTGDLMPACPHQAKGQPITCHFGKSPILQVAFGSTSFTMFISGSLTLTIQPSLAPHPGATPEITPDPSRDKVYPVRWLHCSNTQHPTVTSDAPFVGYEGLNPRFCQTLTGQQNNYLHNFVVGQDQLPDPASH